jgi:hypothetical protein
MDPGRDDGHAVEQILPRLETIVRFADELRGRLGDGGSDGIDGVLGLYRRLRAVLEAVPAAEFDRILAEIDGLMRRLATVRDDLEHLRQLRARLDV